MKNADAPAVKREAEEDWVRKRRTRRTPAEGGAAMDKDYLLLKPAASSRPSGKWKDETMTCLPMALSSAVSSRSMRHRWERRGCGHSSSRTMKAARQHTAMLRRARPQWRHSPKAGGGNKQPSQGSAD